MRKYLTLFYVFFFSLMNLVADEVPLTSEYRVDTMWATAYQISVKITNKTNQNIEKWTANFSLPQGNVLSSHTSGGVFTGASGAITVKNLDSNGMLAPSSSVTFNMIINMPQGGKTTIDNLVVTGVGAGGPAPTPDPTPPGDSNTALSATYRVDTNWATAFQATVTLTNKSDVLVNNWVATFTMPAGFSLSSHLFSGSFTTSGQVVTVKNVDQNATIAPNASVTFGMIINKPSGSASVINNLQAVGNASSITPIPVPAAPVVSVTSGTSSNYTVSWNDVAGADDYLLQEDSNDQFSSPFTAAQGDILSQSFMNKPSDTYFYRVYASNSGGNSPYSNVVSRTVVNNTPIPSRDTIEYSDWYITWTAWFTPPYVIPKNVNMVNIFVGEFMYGADGKPTMGGFGNLTTAQVQDFVRVLGQQPSPIKAKVSIGGGGGSYDRTWDLLNSSNVKAFAQGMVDYCHNVGLAGVDFDYEAFVSSEQEALVGTLIKEFKLLDPNLQTSLCSNAGFPYWQPPIKNILDAAMIAPGNCAVDRFYLMTYYNTMSDEIGWVVGPDGKGGWANWLISNYGFTRARISIGIDDFDAHAYDPVEFRAWAAGEGFSVAHWAFDPARPPQ